MFVASAAASAHMCTVQYRAVENRRSTRLESNRIAQVDATPRNATQRNTFAFLAAAAAADLSSPLMFCYLPPPPLPTLSSALYSTAARTTSDVRIRCSCTVHAAAGSGSRPTVYSTRNRPNRSERTEPNRTLRAVQRSAVHSRTRELVSTQSQHIKLSHCTVTTDH